VISAEPVPGEMFPAAPKEESDWRLSVSEAFSGGLSGLLLWTLTALVDPLPTGGMSHSLPVDNRHRHP
jgi:hypothetical protein